MGQFSRINQSEFSTIMKKNGLTTDDRIKLQSYVFPPLADYCSDLSYGDYDKIHTLEEKNLYKILNVISILSGIFGENTKSQFLGLPMCRNIIRQIQPDREHTKRETDHMQLMMLMLHALSNFNANLGASPVFDGNMPQKLFQFRQQTANEWYEKTVLRICGTAGYIYADLGLEEAWLYVNGYIAHYLNQSQPGKYGIEVTLDMNDNIHRIMNRFINSVSGDNRNLKPIFSTHNTL